MKNWKAKALQAIFDRHMRWRIKDLLHAEYLLTLDYPLRPKPRYGEGKPAHPGIAALLSRNDEAYQIRLSALSRYSGNLMRVAETTQDGALGEPQWDNDYFSALDAIALYGLLGEIKPSRYFEIGSGNSTKFARRAVRDLALTTQVMSVDPNPRAEVDALCDRVIRQPLEDVDATLFDQLEEGDILFVDNSHRVFQNSDVTVFFLEILPRLKPGIVIHIHDVFLPYDYPLNWVHRYYSEQYLLAAFLLAGDRRIQVLLPLAYLSQHPLMSEFVQNTWCDPLFQRSFSRYRHITGGYIGTSFWLMLT